MEEEQSIQTILTFQSAMQPATVSAFRAYTLAIFLFSIRSYEASTISSVTLLNGGWFCGASGGCKIKISGTGFGNEFDRPSVTVGDVPCPLVKYWCSNTTLVCTMGRANMEFNKERERRDTVEVHHHLRKSVCVKSGGCNILVSAAYAPVVFKISNHATKSKNGRHGDVLELYGQNLYNRNVGFTLKTALGPNICDHSQDDEGTPYKGQSYSIQRCRLDGKIVGSV